MVLRARIRIVHAACIDDAFSNPSWFVTPWPTDSTGEFENLSDEAEELCYSFFFLDLCNTYLELAAVMPGQCCLNKIEP